MSELISLETQDGREAYPALITVTAEGSLSVAFAPGEALVSYLEEATERGLSMEVKTATDEKAAAENMNNLAKAISSVEDLVKKGRRPLLDAANAISEEGRRMISLAVRAKEAQGAKIQAWRSEQERLRQEALAEERRKREEAERKRAAEEAEARRKAEEAKAAAEAALRAAERLKWEAEERERLAAEALAASGKRTEAVVAKGAADLAAAAEAADRAAKAMIDAANAAAEAKRLEEEARVKETEVLAPASVVVIPEAPGKTKGIKTEQVPSIDGIDKAKLPLEYMEPDLVLIKRHLKDGVKIPGVSFHFTEVIKPTKRG